MKNIKLFSAAALFLVIILSFTGCSKTAITAQDFKSAMETKGFEIESKTDSFSDYEELNFKHVYIASNNSVKYKFAFYELSTPESAVRFYEMNRKLAEDTKTSMVTESYTNFSNNASYSLTTGGKYTYISRVENTVLYVNAASKYKAEIKEIIEELGY